MLSFVIRIYLSEKCRQDCFKCLRLGLVSNMDQKDNMGWSTWSDYFISVYNKRGSDFSSYEIELRNWPLQNDVTPRVTNSKFFIEFLLSSYFIKN